MSITKKDIQILYPNFEVKQEGSKQLFYVWIDNINALILSYTTIVGVINAGTAYITTEKYSVTTTQQCNYVERTQWCSERVDAAHLQSLVTELLARV